MMADKRILRAFFDVSAGAGADGMQSVLLLYHNYYTALTLSPAAIAAPMTLGASVARHWTQLGALQKAMTVNTSAAIIGIGHVRA